MNKIGFSKEKWTKILEIGLILIPISFLLVIIAGIFAADPKPLSERSFGSVVLYVLLVVAVVVEVIFLIWYLFHLTIGRKFYRRYAKEMIDYKDDDPVREVSVSREEIKIVYQDGHHIETESFDFSEYDITVKTRENYKIPVFYVYDNIIRKVVLPYSEEDDPKWQDYKVLKMKRRR